MSSQSDDQRRDPAHGQGITRLDLEGEDGVLPLDMGRGWRYALSVPRGRAYIVGFPRSVRFVPYNEWRLPERYRVRIFDPEVYEVEQQVRVADGQPHGDGLTVHPRCRAWFLEPELSTTYDDGREELTTVGMRKIRPAQVLRNAILAGLHTDTRPPQPVDPSDWRQQAMEVHDRPPARQGAKLDHAHFETVADIYKRALLEGRDPVQTVADRLGVKRPTAGRYVWRARNEHHLLPPTTPGKAGG
ncbi:MAG: hypothetical protein KG028_05965 [Actinobacteria bacterium]|jgi:hypothetical protein|nr:hypothetical protein [Actinomycetota bacterium]